MDRTRYTNPWVHEGHIHVSRRSAQHPASSPSASETTTIGILNLVPPSLDQNPLVGVKIIKKKTSSMEELALISSGQTCAQDNERKSSDQDITFSPEDNAIAIFC
jgi:hypothetical protein